MARTIDEKQRNKRMREILDASVRVFSKKGVSAKISDIAKEAGLSYGHVYNHFESKEHILMAIIREGQESYRNKLMEAQNIPGNSLDKLLFLTENFLAKSKGPHAYLVASQASFSDLLTKENKNHNNQKSQENMMILISILKNGQEEGVIIEGDVQQLAILYTTLLQNLLLNDLRGFAPLSNTTYQLIVQLFSAKR